MTCARPHSLSITSTCGRAFAGCAPGLKGLILEELLLPGLKNSVENDVGRVQIFMKKNFYLIINPLIAVGPILDHRFSVQFY